MYRDMKLNILLLAIMAFSFACQNKHKKPNIFKAKATKIEDLIKLPNKIDSLKTEEAIRDFMVSLEGIYSKAENIRFGFNTVYHTYHKRAC